MQRRQSPSDALLDLARHQAYTVSRQQCLAHGLGPEVIARLLREQWQVITPGVYGVHRLPIEWAARAWTGILLGGPTAQLGGRAAAYAHAFAGAPDLVQVWVDKTPPRVRPGLFFRRDTAGRARDHGAYGLPCTGVADTVLDVCERADPDAMAATIAAACNETPVSPDDLRRALDGRRALRQRELVEECIDLVAGGAHSALERRYVVDVEQAHGLPVAQRQVWTGLGTRVDALVVEFGLVIELDGRRGHLGTGAFRDLARDNRHTSLGLAHLRYGWTDVSQRPCEVARQVASVLMRRGWEGPFVRCPSCGRAPLPVPFAA